MLYVSSNNVRDHELRDRDTYVSQRNFEMTIARIEVKIERMEGNVGEQMQIVADKLDRNLNAIARLK